jgi:prepilin-type N-terminal cleavage/methylation domain-containing protein
MNRSEGFGASGRSTEHGFTLIELLVAMVAGSLLLATLSWTLATLGRELRSSQRAEPRQRLDAVAPVLANLIEQTLPTAKDERAIVARPQRLVFVTMPPAALGATGPVRATLSVRPHQAGEALYARFEPAAAAAAFPAAARAERRLIEGYRHIRFDYALAPKEEAGLPPKLVTISLSDAEGRSVRLAAAPRLNSSGACRFDPISMTCRR